MEAIKFSQRNIEPDAVKFFIKELSRLELPEVKTRKKVEYKTEDEGLSYIEFEILKKQLNAALKANVDMNNLLEKDETELKELKEDVVNLEKNIDKESKEERLKALKEIENDVKKLENEYETLVSVDKHSEDDLIAMKQRIDMTKKAILNKKKQIK